MQLHVVKCNFTSYSAVHMFVRLLQSVIKPSARLHVFPVGGASFVASFAGPPLRLPLLIPLHVHVHVHVHRSWRGCVAVC